VRRREFITLLGTAVGWPLAASAETQPKIPRVGYVSAVTSTLNIETFRQGLRELGYVEAQTIVLEVPRAKGRLERMPELGARLVCARYSCLSKTKRGEQVGNRG